MVLSNTVDLIARLGLDSSGFRRGVNEVESATGRLQRQTNQVNTAGGRLTTTFKNLAGGVALGAAASQAIQFGVDAVNSFNNLNESVNAVNKVFEDAAGTVLSFGEGAAESIGIANSEFNQLSITLGGPLKRATGDVQFAADETLKLSQRASDMASVFNTDVSTAVQAIGSLFRGESEPIRQFNVDIQQADIAARAVALGLAESTSAVDDNAKALATLDLLYEQTADTAGDFADTAGDGANRTRIVAARFEDAKAAFGEALIPLQDFALTLAETAIPALELFGGLVEGIGGLGGPFVDFLNNVANSASDVGDDGEQATGFFADTIEALRLMSEQQPGVVRLFDATRDGVEGVNLLLDPFTKSIDKSAEGLAGLKDSAEDAAPAVDEVADSVADARDESDDAGPSLQDVAEGMLGIANNALDAALAMANYASELKAQVDPAFAAARAMSRLRDDQAKLAEVQADGEATATDVAEAQLAVAESLIEAQIALDGLNADGPAQAIQSLSDILGISEAAARDLLTQLGLLDGKQVTTVVETQFTTRGSLPTLPPNQLPGGLIDTIGGRAQGGPVTANTPFLVGERGPELFVPSVNGNIVPNNQMTSGGQVHVTINNPVANNVEDDTRRGLQYASLLQLV